MAKAKTRVGVIGCGDVAHRRYLPALAGLADQVELVGCCDARPEAAEQAADAVRGWSPDVKAFTQIRDLAEARPDAVFNLTPAPFHAEVTSACLEAGMHVFSEKPIASTVAEAGALIDAARSRGLLLLCAPGSAATRRVRWLAEVAELNPYAQKILVNTQTAKSKGFSDKDNICVESSVGKVFGIAKVTECIHPEAVGISSHFGSLCKGKPVAYGKGANFNKLLPYDTDTVSTGVDGCVMVKVYKV